MERALRATSPCHLILNLLDHCVLIDRRLLSRLEQWARLASHANGDVGSAAYIHVFKYADYLLTCPLLTLDLLWSLNLPYKVTGAMMVFTCILCALGCQVFFGPARYMWFGFGLTLFCFTWINILLLTRQRLCQLVSKEALKMRDTLTIGLACYFGIWLCFPTLWILREVKIINEVVSLCLHMIIDVLSKSIYGFALLNFQIRSEELDFVYLPLRPRMTEEEIDGMSEVTADVELGPGMYHMSKTHPHGPVLVGSKDARAIARSRGGSIDLSYGANGPRELDASERDMADTVRQIQMLNAQLDSMVGPYDKRAV